MLLLDGFYTFAEALKLNLNLHLLFFCQYVQVVDTSVLVVGFFFFFFSFSRGGRGAEVLDAHLARAA